MNDDIVHHRYTAVAHYGGNNTVLGEGLSRAIVTGRGVELRYLAHLEFVLHAILTKCFNPKVEYR